MLSLRGISFFFLISLLGIHSAYCRLLSFEEGATASYTISRRGETLTRALTTRSLPGDLRSYQSITTIDFDIKILSHETISHWFSCPTHIFDVEVILKKIFLSETTEEKKETDTIQYDSTAQVLENDPLEQALHAIIGIPLHFQIGDQIKETTMQLDNLEHLLLLSTKWEYSDSLNLLKYVIKVLFDLSGEDLLANHVCPISCPNYDYFLDVLIEKYKVTSGSEMYKIHAIDSDKIIGSHVGIFHIKSSGNALYGIYGPITTDVAHKGTVTWNNENSLLQKRDYQTELFFDSEFIRSKVSESLHIDSHPL